MKTIKNFLRNLFVETLFLVLFLPTVVLANGPQKQVFSDIPPSHRYYEAIEYLNNKDLQFVKNSENKFWPALLITRQEACLYFLHASRISIPKEISQNDFTDVPEDSQFFRCIQTAKDKKIIEGGTFRPTEPMTKGEALIFFFKAQGTIMDDYITHAREKGIISGKFNPNKNITKGEMIEMMYRFLQQGPLARVNSKYLEVKNGDCKVDSALKKELLTEIELLPKADAISDAEIREANELFNAAYTMRDKNRNDTPASIEQFKKAVAVNPYFPLAWHFIGMFEINQAKDAASGMRIEQKSRLLVPDDPATTYALHGIASAYKNMGDIKAAETCFKESIRFMPGNHWPYLRLAEMLQEQKRYNEAIFVLDKGLSIKEPTNALYSPLSLLIFNKFPGANGAEFLAKKHLKQNKDLYWLMLLLGDTFRFREIKLTEAAHFYTVALEKLVMYLPHDPSINSDDPNDLLENLQSKNADNEDYYGAYGQSSAFFLHALQSDDPEVALTNIERAIELVPKEARYRITKARILLLLPSVKTNAEEILALLKKAKSLDSFLYDGYFLEGEALLAQGKNDLAAKAYRKVKPYHLDFGSAEERIKMLP